MLNTKNPIVIVRNCLVHAAVSPLVWQRVVLCQYMRFRGGACRVALVFCPDREVALGRETSSLNLLPQKTLPRSILPILATKIQTLNRACSDPSLGILDWK